MSNKPTNPKDAIGADKLPLHLWPATATAVGCIGMLNGALKYGRTNWREAGIRPSIYVDAAKRHIDAWFEGEEVDPDDGVPHLSAALACLAIIIDARSQGKLNDDRQYRSPEGYRTVITEMTRHVGRLKGHHAGRHPAHHYTIADNVTDHDMVRASIGKAATPDIHDTLITGVPTPAYNPWRSVKCFPSQGDNFVDLRDHYDYVATHYSTDFARGVLGFYKEWRFSA